MVEGDSVGATSVTFNISFVVCTGVSVVVWSNVVGASVTISVVFSGAAVLGAIVAGIVALAVKTNRKGSLKIDIDCLICVPGGFVDTIDLHKSTWETRRASCKCLFIL